MELQEKNLEVLRDKKVTEAVKNLMPQELKTCVESKGYELNGVTPEQLKEKVTEGLEKANKMSDEEISKVVGGDNQDEFAIVPSLGAGNSTAVSLSGAPASSNWPRITTVEELDDDDESCAIVPVSKKPCTTASPGLSGKQKAGIAGGVAGGVALLGLGIAGATKLVKKVKSRKK